MLVYIIFPGKRDYLSFGKFPCCILNHLLFFSKVKVHPVRPPFKYFLISILGIMSSLLCEIIKLLRWSNGVHDYLPSYPMSLYSSSLVCIFFNNPFCVPFFFNSSRAFSIAFMPTRKAVIGKDRK